MCNKLSSEIVRMSNANDIQLLFNNILFKEALIMLWNNTRKYQRLISFCITCLEYLQGTRSIKTGATHGGHSLLKFKIKSHY